MLHLRRTALVRPLRSAGQAARLVGRRRTLSVQWDASASASTDGIWEEGPDFVMQPEELTNVRGERVVLQFPRCAAAHDVTPGVGTWNAVRARGLPPGLSREEAQQWRQEVGELHELDEAVREYHERYAQVEPDSEPLTSMEMLERKSAQRKLLEAGWFKGLATHISSDIAGWASFDPQRPERRPRKQVRQRDEDKVPTVAMKTLDSLVYASSIAGPRHVALASLLQELTLSKWTRLDEKPPKRRDVRLARESDVLLGGRPLPKDDLDNLRRSSTFISALEAAQQRVLALPDDAPPGVVMKALRAVGVNDGRQGAKNERAMLARVVSTETKKGGKDARERLHHALGDDLYHRHLAELTVTATYDRTLELRLSRLSEQLATITVAMMTNTLLQPNVPEGIKLQDAVNDLMRVISAQYTHDRLIAYREEQVREAEEAVAHADARVDELASKQREDDASLVGGGGLEEEAQEARDESNRKRRLVYYRKLGLENSTGFNVRQTQTSARALKQYKGLDLTPAWDTATQMHIGAYLIDGLVKHARFRPVHDEVARSRNLLQRSMNQARRSVLEAQGIAVVDLEDEPFRHDSFDSIGIESDAASRRWLDSLVAGSINPCEDDEDGGTRDMDDDEALFGPSAAAIDDGPTKDDGVQSHGHGEELHTHTDMYVSDVASMTADHLSAESSETQLVDPWLSNAPFADDDDALDDATEFRLGADGLMPAFVIGQRRGPPPLPSALSKEASQLEQLKEQNRVFIAAHVALYDDLVAGDLSNLRSRLEPDAKPMLVPPLAWQKPYAGEMPIGGQLHIRTEFVRTHSHRHKAIIAATPTAAYQRVVSGLDALSATKWNVNERVLRIVQYLWEAQLSGLPYVADAPSVVRMPEIPDLRGLDPEAARKAEKEYVVELQLAMAAQRNLHSQRVSARLKLDVANEFAGDDFYFPHNLDFRGRSYAVGPHLQYLGDDLARGLLSFAQPKPLGARGLYWLKVQLANLYGKDKLSLDERVAWTDGVIAEGILREVDRHPMSTRSLEWWSEAEAPVQALALCFELQAALDSPDPAAHPSRASVHMDGSCNGLQHYAAIGRDPRGAAQVNLMPGERPADIYSGVRELVEAKVHAEATRGDEGDAAHDDDDDEAELAGMTATQLQERALKRQKALDRRRYAMILDGHVSRKVVKQTVMTSVYGVTLIGAKDQIYNRLWDLFKEGAWDEHELEVKRADLPHMALFLAKLTLESLNENFKGATESMKWLVKVAQRISVDSKMPVEWETPLGWPVLQPYFQIKKRRVKTIVHSMSIMEEDDLQNLQDNSRAPVKITKQKSAMPPNYVHSLDSSHMLMTATRCREEGMTFAAVHDSYWTHAADVDRMNVILREEFVELHKQATLDGLLEQLKEKYCCARGEGEQCAGWNSDGPCNVEDGCRRVKWEQLEPPPKPGDFDIEQVKDSTYFFS